MEQKETGEFKPLELVKLAGLDQTPEDIATAYRSGRDRWFWKLARSRKRMLVTEKLIERPASIRWRTIGWSLYAICQISILTAALFGWIPWLTAVVAAATAAAAATVAGAATATVAVAAGDRSGTFKEPFFLSLRIVLGRTFIYFPIMPFVRLFDRWVARHADHLYL